jgi:hypothetical protein
MSLNLNLRYQKKDAFGNEIFIASNKYDNEKEAFETLKKLESKLKDLFIIMTISITARFVLNS